MTTSRTRELPPFEIAPPLMAGGRPLVVGILHRMLANDGKWRRSSGADKALLLVALEYQVARRLIEDLELEPRPLEAVGRRWQPSSQTQTLPGSCLTWIGLEAPAVRPLPQTRVFLDALPDTLIKQVVAWAPPVVIPAKGSDGLFRVVANYIPALLARQRMMDTPVQVRRLLLKTTTVRRSLPEVCQAVVHLLEPVFLQNRGRIVKCAPSEEVGCLLSGYGRSQFHNLRTGGG